MPDAGIARQPERSSAVAAGATKSFVEAKRLAARPKDLAVLPRIKATLAQRRA